MALAAAAVAGALAYARWHTTSVAQPRVPACDAAGLVARAQDRGSLRGNTKTQVLLTNMGRNACALTGYPRIAGVDEATVVPLQASHDTYFGDPEPMAAVPPGETVAFYLTGGMVCATAGAKRWPELRITLPSETSLQVLTSFDASCGLAVSAFGRPDDT